MERLANTQRGLNPRSIWKLYNTCITTIADYASPVWWKSRRSIQPLKTLQLRAARKILGVFRTTPSEPSELEANLLPTEIRLERQGLKYALRTNKLPENHPICKILRETQLRTTCLTFKSRSKLTRLQDTKYRKFWISQGLENAKSKIDNQMQKAWAESFQKAKDKKNKGNKDSYFNRFSWKDKPLKERLPIEGKRATTSAYYSIIFGHGYLKSYLSKIGKTETDKCNCGLKQTAEHLLFRCKYYNQDRPKLLRQAKSIQDILKENNGQKAIYDFLDITGIATRK